MSFPSLRTTFNSAESATATLSNSVLPPHAYVALRDGGQLCRIITSIGHAGRYETASELGAALEDMVTLLAAGFTTFDVSDHFVTEQNQETVTVGDNLVITGNMEIGEKYLAEDYSHTEEFVGAFVDRLGGDASASDTLSFWDTPIWWQTYSPARGPFPPAHPLPSACGPQQHLPHHRRKHST